MELTEPYTILLADINVDGPALRNYLIRRPDLRLIEISSSEIPLRGVLHGDQHPDVVVLGSGFAQPLAAAGHLRRQSPRAQVVFLVRTERMERFRASLPFVPQLSDAWTAAAEDSGDAVGAVILEAARAARSRESVRSVFDRINMQVSSKAALGEAQRRERQIFLSERFMATVLMQAPDPIFAIDPNGEVVSSNDAASRLFTGHRNGTVGQPALRLFPDGVRSEIDGLFVRARSGEIVQRYETLVAIGEHSTRNAVISLAPIRDSEGQIVGYAVTMRDITERRRLDELEKLLRQRQNIESLGQLASSIAHEIGQPLAAMVTNGSAALRWLHPDRPDLGEARSAIERIVAEGNRAGRVVASIRSLVKKEEQQKIALDLNELVGEVLALTEGEIKRHRVVVQTQLRANLPRISAERVQLQQVVLNLIMNAVQAMASVDGRIRLLRVKSEEPDQDGVAVTIEDSGIGIAAENFNRIFEPFFTTKPNGMGMGLSICRSIIEAHGGRLSASPGRPHGTAFQFTIPFEKTEEIF